MKVECSTGFWLGWCGFGWNLFICCHNDSNELTGSECDISLWAEYQLFNTGHTRWREVVSIFWFNTGSMLHTSIIFFKLSFLDIYPNARRLWSKMTLKIKHFCQGTKYIYPDLRWPTPPPPFKWKHLQSKKYLAVNFVHLIHGACWILCTFIN